MRERKPRIKQKVIEFEKSIKREYVALVINDVKKQANADIWAMISELDS